MTPFSLWPWTNRQNIKSQVLFLLKQLQMTALSKGTLQGINRNSWERSRQISTIPSPQVKIADHLPNWFGIPDDYYDCFQDYWPCSILQFCYLIKWHWESIVSGVRQGVFVCSGEWTKPWEVWTKTNGWANDDVSHRLKAAGREHLAQQMENNWSGYGKWHSFAWLPFVHWSC